MPDPSMYDMFEMLNKTMKSGFRGLLTSPFDKSLDVNSATGVGGGRVSGGSGGNVKKASGAGDPNSLSGASVDAPNPATGGITGPVGANYNPLTDPYFAQRSQEHRDEYMGKIQGGEYSEDFGNLLTNNAGNVNFQNLFTDEEYIKFAIDNKGYSALDLSSSLEYDIDRFRNDSQGGTITLGNFQIILPDKNDSAAIRYKLADGSWSKRYRRYKEGEVNELKNLFGVDMFSVLNVGKIQGFADAAKKGNFAGDGSTKTMNEVRAEFESSMKKYLKEANKSLSNVLIDSNKNYVTPAQGEFKKNFYKEVALKGGIENFYNRVKDNPELLNQFIEGIGGMDNYKALIGDKVAKGVELIEEDLQKDRAATAISPTGLYNSIINKPISSSIYDDDDFYNPYRGGYK